ncbi:MAG: transcription termination factor NusA [Oceanicaulis sp.]
MAIGVSANKLEILQIARAVAAEKMIDEAIVLEAIEEAIQKAARSRYGAELDIHCDINPKTGEMRLTSRITVVDEVENDTHQLTLEQARKRDPEAHVGKVYEEELPPIEFGRVASQTAKQVITQKVREAERQRQYEEYKDRVGEIVNGIVKRVEYGNVIVDLGKAEGIIRRSDGIPRESLQVNDRVRAYIYDVREEARGPQIFLSRSHPDFMAALFAQEVPEVYEGVIEIPRVARDPGSRAKIAVISNDSSIDPVGACVGMRGSRVQAVVNELAGEKIDIIPWNPDPATFIVNALQPAEVAKVVLDDEDQRIEVVVTDEQLSLAIGRRGQNVRLASQLTGWAIDILTEEEESERRQKEFSERTALFMEALDVDEVIAQLLATEGFADMEDLAFVDLDEIAVIEGFDDDTANEIQTRAREYLEKQAAEQDAKRKELGVEDAVMEIEGVDLPMAVRFGENEVFTVEDVAGLTPDDLRGWYETRDGERVREPGILDGMDMSAEDAEGLIMRARVAAGWIEADALEPETAEDEGEGVEEAGEDVDLDDIDLADLEAEAERLGVDLSELLGEDKGLEVEDKGEAPAEDADPDREDDEER